MAAACSRGLRLAAAKGNGPSGDGSQPKGAGSSEKDQCLESQQGKPSAEPTLIWTRALISRVSSSSTVARRPAILAALIGQKGMGKTMTAGQGANPGAACP